MLTNITGVLGVLACVLLAGASAASMAAAEASVNFNRKLWNWDGFGVNYVETHHTRDYSVWAEDYGGFKYLDDAQRERVIELIFGDDGLKPGIVKAFCDPFHEPQNDNDDPYRIDPGRFDHLTTTRWIRHFAKRGLELTRRRGDDLTFFAGLYGPPGWMTRQQVLLGRDLAPGMMPELIEYLAAWVKHLREVECLPVKYASPHNEGEAKRRWPEDGGDPVSHYQADYNLWWPEAQVVEFLSAAREIFDRHGMQAVGLGSGEPLNWQVAFNFARQIHASEAARRNLALFTSHGFMKRYDSRGIDLLRTARSGLHSWTTSYTWGDMTVDILEDARNLIYTSKCNALIPWAVVHNDYESDKLSPPAGKRVSTNANSPFKTNDGKLEVTKAYYHYKQVSRIGQPGTAVVEVAADTPDIGLIAFASNGTKHGNGFVLINLSKTALPTKVKVAGSALRNIAAFLTTDPDHGDKNFERFRDFRARDGIIEFTAPARASISFSEVR